jgi:hypothetical protein
MEQLLAQLREVFTNGQELIAEYKQKLAIVTDEKKSLDDMRASLDERHHGMEAREIECKKVENAVNLHKQAKDIMESATARLQLADQAEKDLKTNAEKEHAELNNKRELTRREVQAQEKQKKDIDDEVKKRLKYILSKMGIDVAQVG